MSKSRTLDEYIRTIWLCCWRIGTRKMSPMGWNLNLRTSNRKSRTIESAVSEMRRRWCGSRSSRISKLFSLLLFSYVLPPSLSNELASVLVYEPNGRGNDSAIRRSVRMGGVAVLGVLFGAYCYQIRYMTKLNTISFFHLRFLDLSWQWSCTG